MMLTFIGVLVIVLFAVIGYFRGALKILLAFAALLAGAVLGGPLSPIVRGPIENSGYVPRALAPLASHVAMSVALFLLFVIIGELMLKRRADRRELEGLPRMSGAERWAGGALGVAWGMLLVTITYTGLAIIGTVEEAVSMPAQASPRQAEASTADAGPFTALRGEIESSPFGTLVEAANPVDEKIGRTFRNLVSVVSDPDMAESFRSHPDIARFVDDPRLVALAEDEEIQRHVQASDYYALLDNEKIAALLNDRQLVRELSRVDLDRILAEVMARAGSEEIR